MNEFPSENVWIELEERQNGLILRLEELNDRIEAALAELERQGSAVLEKGAA